MIERNLQAIIVLQLEPAQRRRNRRITWQKHPPWQPTAQQVQDPLDN